MRVRGADADGFSLTEIIIAMFLLMIIALALLPALIGATRTSVVNSSLVAATSFANAQLAPIRAAFPDDPPAATSCEGEGGLHEREAPAVPDPAIPATGLFAQITVGECTDEYPNAVDVTVKVYESDPDEPLVTITTKVLVNPDTEDAS